MSPCWEPVSCKNAEAALKEGRTLGGHMILRTVMRYYKPHDQSVEYYRITNMSGLQVVDGNLEAFQMQWNKWLAGLKEMPPDTFLPEKGLASGEVENGRWPGMGGLFGCDSATRSCCEKKIEQQDIRIAHNRPVIQQVCVCPAQRTTHAGQARGH